MKREWVFHNNKDFSPIADVGLQYCFRPQPYSTFQTLKGHKPHVMIQSRLWLCITAQNCLLMYSALPGWDDRTLRRPLIAYTTYSLSQYYMQ